MLILTRKPGQEVCIGAAVVVRFVAMQDGKVRLGIDAPREVPVFRRELVTAGAVLLTPAEREDEMREAGSRRFTRLTYEPPAVTDLPWAELMP
jgi:carbon storage regulator